MGCWDPDRESRFPVDSRELWQILSFSCRITVSKSGGRRGQTRAYCKRRDVAEWVYFYPDAGEFVLDLLLQNLSL